MPKGDIFMEHNHNHRRMREWLALLVLTVSFFGLFFPNYTLTDEVCTVSMEECGEEATGEQIKERLEARGITYRDLHSGKVRVRSRLLEWFSSLWH